MHPSMRAVAARLIAFLVATTVCPSAFSSVIGSPVAPQGASIDLTLTQVQPGNVPAANQSGTGNGQVLDDGLGVATALYTGDDGSVVAKISAGGGGTDESARAIVTWFFMVVGPPPATTPVYVPVFFQGHGLLSIRGLNSYYDHYEEANATAAVWSSLPGFNNGPANLTDNGTNRFGLSMGGYALAYQSYAITLTVTAESGGADTATVEADLDPLIEIDPDFASQGYTLLSSAVPPLDGQAVAGSVPEPSTPWIMLAGGLGLLAVRIRGRGQASPLRTRRRVGVSCRSRGSVSPQPCACANRPEPRPAGVERSTPARPYERGTGVMLMQRRSRPPEAHRGGATSGRGSADSARSSSTLQS